MESLFLISLLGTSVHFNIRPAPIDPPQDEHQDDNQPGPSGSKKSNQPKKAGPPKKTGPSSSRKQGASSKTSTTSHNAGPSTIKTPGPSKVDIKGKGKATIIPTEEDAIDEFEDSLLAVDIG